jgi:hypothetical protein
MKITRILSKDNWSQGRDLNPAPPEYDAGVLTTPSRHVVRCVRKRTCIKMRGKYPRKYKTHMFKKNDTLNVASKLTTATGRGKKM